MTTIPQRLYEVRRPSAPRSRAMILVGGGKRRTRGRTWSGKRQDGRYLGKGFGQL
jgi:hypothetical protein